MSEHWEVLKTEDEIISAIDAGEEVDFGSPRVGRIRIRGSIDREYVHSWRLWNFGFEFRVLTKDKE